MGHGHGTSSLLSWLRRNQCKRCEMQMHWRVAQEPSRTIQIARPVIQVQRKLRSNRTGLFCVARKQPNFKRALRKWSKLWGAPGLAECVAISFSPRMKKSLGRTLAGSGKINLHAGLLSAPRRFLLQVLCHESAHVAVVLLTRRRKQPHGPEWRKLVETAGYKPSLRMACRWLKTPVTRPINRRQGYRCPICQAVYFQRRRNARLVCPVCDDAGISSRLRPVAEGNSTR